MTWHGQSPQQLWDRDAVSDLIAQARAEERERVSRVIAEVRAQPPLPSYAHVQIRVWHAACDAIEAALQGDTDA